MGRGTPQRWQQSGNGAEGRVRLRRCSHPPQACCLVLLHQSLHPKAGPLHYIYTHIRTTATNVYNAAVSYVEMFELCKRIKISNTANNNTLMFLDINAERMRTSSIKFALGSLKYNRFHHGWQNFWSKTLHDWIYSILFPLPPPPRRWAQLPFQFLNGGYCHINWSYFLPKIMQPPPNFTTALLEHNKISGWRGC